MNKQYLKNFRENFMLVISRTSLLIIFTFMACVFWITTLEFIRSIDDTIGQTLTTLVMMFVFIKVLLFLDLGNLLNQAATDWYDAFAYGTINNKVTTIVREDTYRKYIVNKIIEDYEREKEAEAPTKKQD